MDIDCVLRAVGKPGRYQVLVFICLSLNNMVVVLNHLAMAVYGIPTPHHCSPPPPHGGATTNTSLGDGLPWGPDSCSMWVNVTEGNSTSQCVHGHQHTMHEGQRNIIAEFDLVCENSYLLSLSTTIYFCGVMLGGLLFGSLSDRYGRKPFMLLCLYGPVLIGTALAFVNSYTLFTLLRFIQGVFMQGLQTSSFVMIMELFPIEYRTLVGCGFEVFWGIGVLWLALIAYLLPNWRHMQLAISLPSAIAVFYIWFVTESPRWLLANHKSEKFEAVLRKAAKFNNMHYPESSTGDKAQNGAWKGGQDSTTGQPAKVYRYSLIDMFKSKTLCRRSLILFYIWFVIACVYYGLSLSLTSLAGNKYLNLFLGGLCELPAYLLAPLIVTKFGRRLPLCLYMLIGGATGISAGIIPNTSAGDTLQWLVTTLAVLSRVCMAGSFSFMWLYTAELYPTVIRNVSVGACAFWTRVGGVVTPQILHLGRAVFPALPLIIFGALSLVAGVVALLLPETKGRKLADTIQEVNDGALAELVEREDLGDGAEDTEMQGMLKGTGGDASEDLAPKSLALREPPPGEAKSPTAEYTGPDLGPAGSVPDTLPGKTMTGVPDPLTGEANTSGEECGGESGGSAVRDVVIVGAEFPDMENSVRAPTGAS